MKVTPLRMCISCREMKDKETLFRVVKNQDVISLDISGKSNGRGAYICKKDKCIDLLNKNKALQRAFKCEVDYAAIVYQMEKEIMNDRNQ